MGFERSEEGWECVGSTDLEAKGQGSFTEALLPSMPPPRPDALLDTCTVTALTMALT